MIRYVSALLLVMALWGSAGIGSVLLIWTVANVPVSTTAPIAAVLSAVVGLYWGVAYLNGSE